MRLVGIIPYVCNRSVSVWGDVWSTAPPFLYVVVLSLLRDSGLLLLRGVQYNDPPTNSHHTPRLIEGRTEGLSG